ncbi:MAG: cytochrome b N-terminal domain-containing protein [Bryobacteraceae bacterium]|nr:cytochrome b N-terminal domain-containing protein [Bryobacteraceae bacterium]
MSVAGHSPSPQTDHPVIGWLEERTGLPGMVKGFFNEDIPASSGWHQVFGSVALFSFLIQLVTGILLSFNYAPTPGEAWNSVRYIMTELTGGAMMRGLHHWGASIMIIVVVLHMVQVFLWGAYKKPREGTWIVGVFLLLLTLAYGLTGYLLPWDNRAYWGTIVATQIGASIPGAGPWITRLLAAENGIGVATFARFYAIHVLVLPPATLLLVAFHVFLVRKHGVAPSANDRGPSKKFYPDQVFKDTVAIFVTFLILFALAITLRVPLERLADPTDTTYLPRPDWYFLFLFETLKFFHGPAEIVGSVILPNLAIAALILAPWIDRSAVKLVRQRTGAIAVVAVAALTWGGLTLAAVRSTPPTTAIDVTSIKGPEPWQFLSPVEIAGAGLVRREACTGCHATGPNQLSPALLAKARTKTSAELIQHFRNPGNSVSTASFSGPELSALANFSLKFPIEKLSLVPTIPVHASEAALLYQKQQCGACHQVNGVGQKLGPVLNGLAERRNRDWVQEHFLNPQKLSPGTTMPAYKFSSRELDRITTWLLELPSSPTPEA